MGAIAAIRATQFQKLAQVAKTGTETQKEMAEHAIDFLEENPVRVLGPSAQMFFGWLKKPGEDSAIDLPWVLPPTLQG